MSHKRSYLSQATLYHNHGGTTSAVVSRYQKSFLLFLLALASMLTACEKNDDNIDNFTFDYHAYFDSLGITFYGDNLMNVAIEKCSTSANRGKSVGVFGGSLSKKDESEVTKKMWSEYLGMSVTTYGRNGNGYCTQQNIQQQVDMADAKDIYILWSSTNDFWGNVPPGDPADYTEADGYDPGKLATQCGGINYCIRRLREKNPECKIYMFLSLPFFINEQGHVKDSKKHNNYCNFYHYVELQRDCAERQGLAILNQFDIPELSEANKDIFYHPEPDLTHLTESGYAAVAPYQLFFLATETDPLTKEAQ